MLAGKVKDGTDKLEITVNVELSLYLWQAMLLKEMTHIYTEGHSISVNTMVLQNLFYLFILPVFTIMLGHYMEQLYGGKKSLFEKCILESTNIGLYKIKFTYKTVFVLLCFKYKSYFYQKLDLKNFSHE